MMRFQFFILLSLAPYVALCQANTNGIGATKPSNPFMANHYKSKLAGGNNTKNFKSEHLKPTKPIKSSGFASPSTIKGSPQSNGFTSKPTSKVKTEGFASGFSNNAKIKTGGGFSGFTTKYRGNEPQKGIFQSDGFTASTKIKTGGGFSGFSTKYRGKEPQKGAFQSDGFTASTKIKTGGGNTTSMNAMDKNKKINSGKDAFAKEINTKNSASTSDAFSKEVKESKGMGIDGDAFTKGKAKSHGVIGGKKLKWNLNPKKKYKAQEPNSDDAFTLSPKAKKKNAQKKAQKTNQNDLFQKGVLPKRK